MRYWILTAALAAALTSCNNDDDDNTDTPAQPNNPGADFAMDVISSSTFNYRVQDLPAPDTNASVTNYPQVLAPRPANARFQAPAGFVVNLFEEAAPGVRNVVAAPNGDIFAAFSNENAIKVMRDTDNDGHSDTTFLWASGGVLSRPHGMAFHQGKFYVANSGNVVRYDYASGQTKATGEPVMLAQFPGGGQHPYRGLLIDSAAGKMYVSIGSSINAAGEDDERRASIQQYNLDGSGNVAFATGIRNPFGLARNPVTGNVWSVVNERDGIGDELVPDYMAEIPANSFWGWPYVYFLPTNRDPRVPIPVPNIEPRIAETRTPEVLFKAHAAALGIMFYEGSQFPEEYRGDAYVTMRGSWNRQQGYGYKLVRVKMNAQGKAEGGYENFVTGWHLNAGSSDVPQVFGRPVSLCTARDGSILITDDAGGAVWRLRYKGQ